MKYLIFLLLFIGTVHAAPRDVVFSWTNPESNANFPPLLAALYEVGTPNVLVADNLSGNEYATHLTDTVGERRYTVTLYYVDSTGVRQESDAAIPVSVFFRPDAATRFIVR